MILKENLQEYVRANNVRRFHVKVLPKSSQHCVVGVTEQGVWKIKLQTAPENGKANKELIGLLSQELQIQKKCIHIALGKTSHLKTIEIVL